MKSLPIVIERTSPTHRVLQLRGPVVMLLGFYLYIVNVVENFSAIRWAIAVTLAMAILGLNIVTGYSGQISIGHSAFFGIGAYTTMILIADHGWPFLATLPVAGALGFLVGAVIGIPGAADPWPLPVVDHARARRWPSRRSSSRTTSSASTSPASPAAATARSSAVATSRRHGLPLEPAVVGAGRLDDERLGLHDGLRDRDRHVRVDLEPRSAAGSVAGWSPCATTRPAPPCRVCTRRSTRCWPSPPARSSPRSAEVASRWQSTTIGPDTFGLQRSIEFIAGLVIGGVATILGPAIGGLLVEWLPYWAFEVDWPLLGKLEGPQAGILYGVILVSSSSSCPAASCTELRHLRSKVVVFVPRLPAPERDRRDTERPAAAPQPDHARQRDVVDPKHPTNNEGEVPMRQRSARVESDLPPRSACRSSPLRVAATTTAARRPALRPRRDATEAPPETTAPQRRTRPPLRPRVDRGTDTSVASTEPAAEAFPGPTDNCPADTTEALADGAPVKIGFIGPQTGPLAAFGVIGQGMKVYFDKINAEQDGVDGHLIEVVTKDDALRPGEVGTCRAGGARGRQDLRLGVPDRYAERGRHAATPRRRMCATSTRRHRLPELGRPGKLPVDDRWHSVVHGRVPGLGGVHQDRSSPTPRRSRSCRSTTTSARPTRRALGEALPAAGYEIVADLAHEATSDLSNEVTQILASGPDVIIGGTTSTFCTSLMTLARQGGFTGPIINSYTCQSIQQFMVPAGEAAANVFTLVVAKDPSDPVVRRRRRRQAVPRRRGRVRAGHRCIGRQRLHGLQRRLSTLSMRSHVQPRWREASLVRT